MSEKGVIVNSTVIVWQSVVGSNLCHVNSIGIFFLTVKKIVSEHDKILLYFNNFKLVNQMNLKSGEVKWRYENI